MGLISFRNWLAQVPPATGGVALGVGSISKAWLAYALPIPAFMVHSIWLSMACALGLLTAKYLFNPKLLTCDLACPTTSSVLPTAFMATLILATFISPLSLIVAQLMWGSALSLHFLLLLFFIYRHGREFEMTHFVPSWFIPPIGVGVAAITAPAIQAPLIGQLCLWLALLFFALLFPAMLYRLARYESLAVIKRPMLAIMAAPSNLCMAGLLTLYPQTPLWALLPLLALSVLMILLIYGLMWDLLQQPFHPGWAAMTFPLAISSYAQHAAVPFLQLQWPNLASWLTIFAAAQMVLASLIIAYIALRYLSFFRVSK